MFDPLFDSICAWSRLQCSWSLMLESTCSFSMLSVDFFTSLGLVYRSSELEMPQRTCGS